LRISWQSGAIHAIDSALAIPDYTNRSDSQRIARHQILMEYIPQSARFFALQTAKEASHRSKLLFKAE